MSRTRTYRQVPYPMPRLAAMGVKLDMSGWCSECGQYLERENEDSAVLDASGETHRHSNPWKLGPEPTQEEATD